MNRGTPDAPAEGQVTQVGETATFADKAEMFDLLREEARFSNAMRRQSQSAQETAATEDRRERKPPRAATGGGDIRVAVLLVALLTALWLTFEFNLRLAEEFPTAAPYLQQYHDTILNLTDRANELIGQLFERIAD